MERISIKNVHFSEALSEETNAYTADVYLDNKKFGYAKNNGQGGCTFINPYQGKRDELREAEAYAKGLGEIEFGSSSIGKFTMKASLDMVVDKLLSDHIEAKQLKSLSAEGLVYKEGQFYKTMRWNVPLKKVLAHPKGNGMVRAAILELESQGHKVLNTNIPEEVLQ